MRIIFTCFVIFILKIALSYAEPANPKAYLQMIYEDKGGYTIPLEETAHILKEGGHPQYGEIPYDSAAHIIADLNLTKEDVFYDLGSGVGKLVLQIYLTTPVKKSVGIELSPTRWKMALASQHQLTTDDHIISGRDLSFLNQNIRLAPFNDATVCFISGITFPTSLIQMIMNRLASLGHECKVISVLPLPDHKHFKLLKTYNVPMSWAPEGVDVCLYQVTPQSLESVDKIRKRSPKRESHQGTGEEY